MKDKQFGLILLVAGVLVLGLVPGVKAVSVCDTDPACVSYEPTADLDQLEAQLDLLGSADLFWEDTGAYSPGTLFPLFNHTLTLTLDSTVSLEGAGALITPAPGSIEVQLVLPPWQDALDVSMDHDCPDCTADYNDCVAPCDTNLATCNNECTTGYNTCYSNCLATMPLCPLCCQTSCGTLWAPCKPACTVLWVGCEGQCFGAAGLCAPFEVACTAESNLIENFLLQDSYELSFDSATVTQTADVCMTGDCEPISPLENTSVVLDTFMIHLFNAGEIGDWLNGIFTGFASWPDELPAIIADSFEGAGGQGVLTDAAISADHPACCTDNDGDGFGSPATILCEKPQLDCNDSDPNVNPGMPEVPGNGIDDDCNPNTPQWDAPASVINAEYKGPSDIANYLFLLCIPVGAVLLWKGLRRKK